MKEKTVEIINKSSNPLPEYMTSGASGLDIYANIDKSIIINSLERVLIPTGIYMSIPEGFEIQVRPRSGLALKHGITVLNSPGTIDADYHGEIGIILVNLSTTPYTINPGDRIAQLVMAEVVKVEFSEVTEFNEKTERGSGGFGHTGKD